MRKNNDFVDLGKCFKKIHETGAFEHSRVREIVFILKKNIVKEINQEAVTLRSVDLSHCNWTRTSSKNTIKIALYENWLDASNKSSYFAMFRSTRRRIFHHAMPFIWDLSRDYITSFQKEGGYKNWFDFIVREFVWCTGTWNLYFGFSWFLNYLCVFFENFGINSKSNW